MDSHFDSRRLRNELFYVINGMKKDLSLKVIENLGCNVKKKKANQGEQNDTCQELTIKETSVTESKQLLTVHDTSILFCPILVLLEDIDLKLTVQKY